MISKISGTHLPFNQGIDGMVGFAVDKILDPIAPDIQDDVPFNVYSFFMDITTGQH